jgi:alkanesulfonate monooxygenase SsuD/methylene tetrahydromethanopterin reductase-like flavin-dependent oxidoreductase (luciferase family)
LAGFQREHLLRIGFGIDTNRGAGSQPVPERETIVAAVDAMVEEGIIAERAGFHSVRVPERHGRTDCYFPGSLQLLTILARETERVAIGAFTMVNTLYHPMLIAEQCAMIDNISRGRLFMAWARGKDYWNVFGVPRERLLGRYLENVRIIEQAYLGERFSFHGDFYDVDDAILSPQPFQQPRFPFWGGGQTPEAIARCGRIAEAWAGDEAPFVHSDWTKTVDSYRESAVAHGKTPFVVMMRSGWVADSFEDAMKEFGNGYIDRLRLRIAARGEFPSFPDFEDPRRITPEAVAEHVVLGSAAQCIERLEFYEEELGVDYITMKFRMPDTSFERTRDQITRFGEEVVSHFHRKDPPTLHPAIPEGVRW